MSNENQWTLTPELGRNKRRQRTVIIQMEIVSQGSACLTRSRHLQCGCVQERHFKGTTALILKSESEIGYASYLGNASFSTMSIKGFLLNVLIYTAEV